MVALGMPAAWTTTWSPEAVTTTSSAVPSATPAAALTALAPTFSGAQAGGQEPGDDMGLSMDESEDTPNFGQSSQLQLQAGRSIAAHSVEAELDLNELD